MVSHGKRPTPPEHMIRANWQQPKRSTTKAPSIWSLRWTANANGRSSKCYSATFPTIRSWPKKKPTLTALKTSTAGSSIRSTARRILLTAIRSFAFPSRWSTTVKSFSDWFMIRCAANASGGKGQGATLNGSAIQRLGKWNWTNPCSPPDFPMITVKKLIIS